MLILVFNCGSSSVKYTIYDSEKDAFICEGLIEKIGEEISYLTHKGKQEYKEQLKVRTHYVAIKLAIKYVLDKTYGVIRSLDEIGAIGHRVVHGGDYDRSLLIDSRIIKYLTDISMLAPLHNPANLAGINAAREIMPNTPQVAVFDTTYHWNLPDVAKFYPLPEEYYTQHKIRRYGFHGISHNYVAQQASKFLKTPLKKFKLITCHLGAGSSLDAVDHGCVVETSMGLTPLEGVMMGTRTGDIDPSVVFYLMSKGMKSDDIYNLLNFKSGLLGVSGVSKDMRTLIDLMKKGNPKCKLAVEMFAYRVRKYIGAYSAVMNGLDVLVFTAGIGENSALVRDMICKGLDHLGIKLDQRKNNSAKGISLISSKDSKVRVLVVPTNEYKMIALETLRVIKR